MPNYEVTDTQQIDDMTRAGNKRTFYRVWLVTENGSSGTVDVPAKDWKPDKLVDIFEAKALELDMAFAVAED